jgi:hypothetical protein
MSVPRIRELEERLKNIPVTLTGFQLPADWKHWQEWRRQEWLAKRLRATAALVMREEED